MSLINTIQTLLKKWYYIVGAVVVCTLLTFVVSYYTIKPVYSTSSLFIVNVDNDGDESRTENPSINTLNYVSEKILNASYTVQTIGFSTLILEDIMKEVPDTTLTVNEIKGSISTSYTKAKQLLYINVSNPNSQNAQLITKSACAMLNQYMAEIDPASKLAYNLLDESSNPTLKSSSASSLKYSLVSAVASLVLSCAIILMVQFYSDNNKKAKELAKNNDLQ